jgi:membrane protein DedA with SNARE-associated domain
MDTLAALSSFLDDMMHFLEFGANDPLSFSLIFLVYTILAAVFLPIPVEIGLFFSPATPAAVKILVMGLGKMLGSMLVYSIGLKIGDSVKAWSTDWKWFGAMVRCCEWMVNKFHYVGLYLILSVPLMTDTVPLYIFSVFNERGVLNFKWFALASLLAGVTRGLIVFLAFDALGVKLV